MQMPLILNACPISSHNTVKVNFLRNKNSLALASIYCLDRKGKDKEKRTRILDVANKIPLMFDTIVQEMSLTNFVVLLPFADHSFCGHIMRISCRYNKNITPHTQMQRYKKYIKRQQQQQQQQQLTNNYLLFL
uniref:Uncharacterized protein n=1 Tax=Glossina austeni TaxID=7395 RepID=A0A1A9VM68_GLOAU